MTKLANRVSISHGRYYKSVDDYTTGKRKQRQIPLSRVADGEVALYRALAALETRAAQGNAPARIDEFCKAYLPTIGATSRKEYRRVYDECKNALAALDTEDVTPADILDVIAQLDTPRMKHHYKSRLSTFFRWAALKRYAPGNPCRDITIPLPVARRVEWTPVIWHAIRDQLAPMLQCYLDLCFLLYQRNTDVRLLTLPQIDDDGIRVTPGKTLKASGKNVTIPLTPAIRAVLARAAELRKQGKPTFYVIAKPDGQPYTASGIRSIIDRAQGRLDPPLKGYTTKSIRPYAAAAAKRAGFSKDQIQIGLAHTSVGTTEGYMERHAEAVSVIVLDLPRKVESI